MDCRPTNNDYKKPELLEHRPRRFGWRCALLSRPIFRQMLISSGEREREREREGRAKTIDVKTPIDVGTTQ